MLGFRLDLSNYGKVISNRFCLGLGLAPQQLSLTARQPTSAAVAAPNSRPWLSLKNSLILFIQLSIHTVSAHQIQKHYYQRYTKQKISMAFFYGWKILIILITYCIVVYSAKTDKLVFVQSILRHGVRYPIYKKQGDLVGQVTETDKLGQLTNEGRYMLYLLGKIFYDRYWMELFGGTKYQGIYDLTQVQIRSTNFNRTIQSASSFMIGLLQKLPTPTFTKDSKILHLPAFSNAESYQQASQHSVTSIYGSSLNNIQNIAIQVNRGYSYVKPFNSHYKYLANPYDEGEFLRKDSNESCPNQKKWEIESDNSPIALIIQNAPIIKKIISNLEQLAGQKINFSDVFMYTDSFLCHSAMNKPYNKMFDDPEMARAAHYFNWMYTFLSKAYHKTHLKAGSTIMLQKTVSNIKAAIAGQGPKMVIYSAHDTTIVVYMGALKLMTLECVVDQFINKTDNSDTCASTPTYGSSINVQVWQSEDKGYKIKFLYNGGYRKIPICDNKQYCLLEQFSKWVESVTDEDPNTLCGIPPLKLPEYYVKYARNAPKQQANSDEGNMSHELKKASHLRMRNDAAHHRLLRNT